MSKSLDEFRKDMFRVKYPDRKDGRHVSARELSADERDIAENEMIEEIQKNDDWAKWDYWPVQGLAEIESKKALPVLYKLLPKRDGTMKIAIAAAIFTICADETMIDVALNEMSACDGLHWGTIVDNIYFACDFSSNRFVPLLEKLCKHEDYLVVYNAKRVLELIGKRKNAE